MANHQTDVLVLGGGVIGLSLALELQKSGRRVSILDKGEIGRGCSYGNAGWITPCFAMPLPQPGMFWKSIGWLLNPDSPLRIQPRMSLGLARWMLEFLVAMNERRMTTAIRGLTDISKYSLDAYARLAARPRAFGFEQKGLLMVSATRDGLAAAQAERELMNDRGIEGRSLTTREIQELEPSLRDGLLGGVYFPTEAHAEPLATVHALADEFREAGGEIHPCTEVFDFEFVGDRVSKLKTTRGDWSCEVLALATGNWSGPLARGLSVRVPILGGKGYSLIIENFERRPQHPIMIVERKIAITPRTDSVRVAGTLELVDQDDSITTRRVNNILRGAQEYLHLGAEPKIREVWRGLRPCTPDGVPMIGRSKKWSNLYYNVGHQMLGLQSAPGSARLAADLILGRDPLTDPHPFRPERFE